ncbi:serine/threonine-protein kinase [Streptomyces sp. NPDC051315]|uniref:serine/threonine-protein kinase n=1 Tax=Streptomyces sp. NPDC051315 TaxID=3365650 RepID=UPI0037A6E9C7
MNDGGDPGADKGRTVGGRYRLLERIGSGGMGTVWRARDELVAREVAVKQPRLPGDPQDESHRRAAHRLYREARAAARVDHPAAVSIHDVVVEEEDGTAGPDGLPWIVMELVRGESLHEVLRRGPLAPAEAARIGLAVLGALRAAHAVGIVHRDVKPANVLLGPHGRVVLTDFGIAHVQGEESLTVSGEFVGSLEFIAPERMSGRIAGPASDLWSLGVLLYAAVEGWSPFRRTTLESTLAAILAAEPPEPKQAGPLGPLVVRLLEKDPERRPGAEQVAVVLEAVAEGWPVPPVPEDEVTETQDCSSLREFADDLGTVRLTQPARASDPAPASDPTPTPGATPTPAPDTASTPDTVTTPVPTPASARPRRPVLVGAGLAVLLAGGAWLATSGVLLEAEDSAATERTVADAPGPAAPTAAATASASPTGSPSPAPGTWIAHREKDLDAVLALPAEYKEAAREGDADDQPRLVVYDTGLVQVRLTRWDKAPGTPMAQAQESYETWNSYNHDARNQTTRTSFQGHDAALSDTTYDMEESPTRVMELFVLTGDGRMYALRVDMPKGTPSEKKGTAVFKGARDRLRIEAP